MSSGSDSDDDYVPGKPEQLSEEESADEETEQQYEEEYETKKNKKRKVNQKKRKQKKRKTGEAGEDDDDDEEEEDSKKELVKAKDPEAEKKKDDDLWAKFLEGTDTKPKPSPKPIENKPVVIAKKEEKPVNNIEERDRRIFEFAGETIVVENNVIKEKIKTTDSPAVATILGGGPSCKPRPGGLSSVLGQINKKNSLSTLEKSKLDWETYKKDEGIEEEVQSTNKGKAGYLERQDFLQRADLRQYELEREARIGRRSNR